MGPSQSTGRSYVQLPIVGDFDHLGKELFNVSIIKLLSLTVCGRLKGPPLDVHILIPEPSLLLSVNVTLHHKRNFAAVEGILNWGDGGFLGIIL